jgi:serine/threonine-protein kinase
LAIELQEATTEKVVARAATVSSNRIGRIAATILAAAAVALGWLYVSKPAPPRSGVTTIGMPRDQFLHYGQQGSWAQFDISPDGKYVVYVGGDDRILFLRETNSFEVRSISEMFCSLPRFSPDGTWIAFFAQSRLWKVAVSGGAPIEVCETTNGGGLGWGPEDFYFPTNNGSAIWTAPIAGGEARPLSKLDDAAHETSHRWPDVLPGGRHALFTIKTADIETLSDAAIGILDLETGEHTVLLRGGTDARYVPTGHIVYGRDSQLFAVPFDVETLSLEGTPVQVLDDIHVASMNGSAHARLSATGDLAYIPDTEIVQSHELVWVELTGKTTRLEIADAGFLNLALAPDGSKFSGMKTAANDKIWIYDLRRRTTSRLTSTPGNDLYSVWSPDGSLIVYSNDRGGGQDLFLIPADGSAPAKKIVEGPEIDFAGSWSPDGSILVFNRVKADGDVDLWTVSMDGAYETTPFLATEYAETTPEFSPDGQWILYVSDITGEPALYLRPFPGPGTATRVSAGRSFGGRWSPDGGTVYYDEGDAINAVTIDPSSGEIGEPEVLIVLGDEYFGEFPLHPDGTRFLANRLDIEDTRQYQIRLVFDWTERLRSLN